MALPNNDSTSPNPVGRPARATPVVLHTRVVNGCGGGPDKTILNSPRFLRNYGYEALCAYMHPPGDPGFEQLRQRATQYEAPLIAVPDRGITDLGVISRMLRICRDHRVTIWHGHDYKSNALGLLLRPFWKMKLVTTVHGWVMYDHRTPLYYKIDRLCLRHYQTVICVSEDLQAQCLEYGVPDRRCVLVHNAIDTEQFARFRSIEDAKRLLGFHPDRLLVGAVGRLSAEKGFDRLIRAADRLLRDGCDLDLIIAGEGDERSRLEALISELGQQDRIRLLGYRADTVDLFQALDVFALSSIREGLPNVVLEALATEVPVVATRIAGVPNVIEDEVNGLLVDPDNVDQLVAALRKLLSDPSQRLRLALAGRQTIEDRYSFAHRMSKIRAIYDNLLAK